MLYSSQITFLTPVADRSKAAEDATRLVLELQTIAHNAGHPVPLAIAVDQENGGVNSLYDETYIRQFPSAMGLAATGSKKLTREVARSTGEELGAVGINWILGPVLDVLTNARNQPLGVRAFGDDPQQASAYGVECMKGYQEAGLATCGKHFPSYGNLEFLGALTDMPTITESVEQLSVSAMVPFRNAIAQGMDSMMVGGVSMTSESMDVMHACLSEQVVQDLLRRDLRFSGVVVSECLEMDALSKNIGVGQGTVMATKAGCDIILICRSFPVQQEAIGGLKLGLENGMIEPGLLQQSLQRVLRLKSRITSWQKALNPGGISLLSELQPSHMQLSTEVYNSSITVVRDEKHLLPLSNVLKPSEELLLLTPLLKPLPASAASKSVVTIDSVRELTASPPSTWHSSASVMSGEQVFRELGRTLARYRNGKVSHTSYTANGVRPAHEDLINRAGAVIVVTADGNRNLYQQGFTKHVSVLCKLHVNPTGEVREKPFIVIAVSSPYDFATESSIGTYICSYDFTETALRALVKVLYGEINPTGVLPGTIQQNQRMPSSRQHWLVENWNTERDSRALDTLLDKIRRERDTDIQPSELIGVTTSTFLVNNSDVEEAHFVVRNSSTKDLYGFCTTYYFPSMNTGVVGVILVDPSRRKLSIGHSLHNRAIRSLLQRKGVKRFTLGSRLPSVYLGIPTGNGVERKRLRQWFANVGWNTGNARPLSRMVLRNLMAWNPPEGLKRSLRSPDIQYDLVLGAEFQDAVLDHVRSKTRVGLLEIYKIALEDQASCGIIRAKRPDDGTILGTVIMYKAHSKLARFIPALAGTAGSSSGISSVVISATGRGEAATLVQGLILLAIRQLKMQGTSEVILDCVDGDAHFDSLVSIGFTILHSFEEVSCDASTWNMLPPS
ncbi:putative beta-n-acetylglucosaminidase [Phaeomoniella chlamydospora]|uniref:Putative beta-n-acetylglucosaminidase n=1 Tax=Phaeomoniella chlamydospora TaxID=158046 RepID=A0A0G2E633_PHACM|nr:putative beta-n-acetylglucosaminidase [Phaeomoniella chlamydospora]